MKSSGENKQPINRLDFKDRGFLFDVVKRCQDGDTEAMEYVYTAFKSSILNLTYRISGDSFMAEDLLQDIFIKIFINIKRLRSPEAFISWLYRIAVNTCMSFARKKVKRNENSIDRIEDTVHSEDGDPLIRQQLEQAVKTLPPKQKIVFQLHDVEGFTHSEIAEIMKSSEGTAKSQLFKARVKIRDFLRSR